MRKIGYPIVGYDPRRLGETVEYALDKPYLDEVAKKIGGTAHLAQVLGLILEKQVLCKPTGVFCGIKRKLFCKGHDETGDWYAAEHVHAFVTAPKMDFQVQMGQIVETVPPKDAVFVALVRFWETNLDQPEYVDPDTEKVFKPRGVIHFWEWVMADPQDTVLPDEYRTRYTKKVA